MAKMRPFIVLAVIASSFLWGVTAASAQTAESLYETCDVDAFHPEIDGSGTRIIFSGNWYCDYSPSELQFGLVLSMSSDYVGSDEVIVDSSSTFEPGGNTGFIADEYYIVQCDAYYRVTANFNSDIGSDSESTGLYRIMAC